MAIDVRKLKEEAAAQLKAGKTEDAIKSLKFLVKVDKREVSHAMKLAELYTKLQQPANAVLWYSSAAKAYAQQGHLPKAIAVAKMVLGIDPNHEEIKGMLSDLYAKKEGGSGGALESMKDKLVDARAATAAKPAPAAAPAAKAPPPEEVLDLELIDEDEPVDLVDLGAEHALSQLPRVPLFSDLNPEEFGKLIDHVLVRSFGPDEVVLVEGEPGDAFYAIISGEASVCKENAAGLMVDLATLKEGAFFGEFAYLSGTPRTASVIAKTELEVLEMNRASMDKLLQEFPNVKKALHQFYRDRVLQNLLRISPLFEPLSDGEKYQILGMFSFYEVPAKAVVLEQGITGDGLYLIASGRVTVNRKATGKEEVLAELKEGEFFGEMSLLYKEKTSAVVRALTPVSLFKLPAATFHGFLIQYPQLAGIIKTYAEERKQRNESTFAQAGLV